MQGEAWGSRAKYCRRGGSLLSSFFNFEIHVWDLPFNDWWDLQGIPLLPSWTCMQSWAAKVLLAARMKLMIITCFCSVPHSLASGFFPQFQYYDQSSTSRDEISLGGLHRCLSLHQRNISTMLTITDLAGSYLPDFAITIVLPQVLWPLNSHCPLSSISFIVKRFPAHPYSLPWKHKQKHYWKWLIMNLA